MPRRARTSLYRRLILWFFPPCRGRELILWMWRWYGAVWIWRAWIETKSRPKHRKTTRREKTWLGFLAMNVKYGEKERERESYKHMGIFCSVYIVQKWYISLLWLRKSQFEVQTRIRTVHIWKHGTKFMERERLNNWYIWKLAGEILENNVEEGMAKDQLSWTMN